MRWVQLSGASEAVHASEIVRVQANYPILCCGVCAIDNAKVTYFDRSLGNCKCTCVFSRGQALNRPPVHPFLLASLLLLESENLHMPVLPHASDNPAFVGFYRAFVLRVFS